jgi:hypothetical protein
MTMNRALSSLVFAAAAAVALSACGEGVMDTNDTEFVDADQMVVGQGLKSVNKRLTTGDTMTVSGAYQDKRFAGAADLYVGQVMSNGSKVDTMSFVSFTVDPIEEGVAKVYLWLYTTRTGASGELYATPAYDPQRLTWNTMPEFDDSVAVWTQEKVVPKGQWSGWDVTDFVPSKKGGRVFFALASQSNAGAIYASSEQALSKRVGAPQLIFYK